MTNAATLRREHADSCTKCSSYMDIHETSSCKAARDLDQQIRQAEQQTSKPQRRSRRSGGQRYLNSQARDWRWRMRQDDANGDYDW